MAVDPDKPFNREEMYLAKAAGEGTTVPDEPWSRKEAYLEKISGRIDDVEGEIEDLKNNPDVADIVDTYADLQAYDTSKLTDKDVIRVLNDETHDGNSTYYRYDKATGTFTYIGSSKTYSAFVGTDGSEAGSEGLVPAPAVTDTGKYLKSDGTWATVNAGPTVVQTTGTSTTNVMSQNAVTSMVYADPSGLYKVRIGNGASIGSTGENIAIGSSAEGSGYRSIAMGLRSKGLGKYSVSIGQETTSQQRATQEGSVAIGAGSSSTAKGAIALGVDTSVSTQGVMNIGPSTTSYGYSSSNYRLLTGLYDPQSAHDAATKGYVDTRVIQNAGAPTTSTVGTVGRLLEDTTNGKLYQCTAVSGNTYTWSEVGGGGGGNDGPIMLFLSEDPDMMEQATMSLYKDAAKTQQVSRQELVDLAENGGLALLRVYDSGNSWYTSFSVLSVYDDADTIIIDMVGGSPYRHIWTLEFNYGNTATVVDKGNMETTGVEETFTKATGDWSALANSSPYTYSTTVTLTTPVSFSSVVELVNNDIVKFATYGFGILSVSGQVATIASIGQPDSSVTFKIKVKNGF